MKKKLHIPFIKSRGLECGQACVSMIIKYFYPNKKIDIDKMNKIIHHKKGKYTFTIQLSILLDHYKIKSECYSYDPLETLEENPNLFKDYFGKDYDKVKKYLDEDTFNWMVKEGRKKKLFKKRRTSFKQIIGFLEKGYPTIFPIDWNTLENKKGAYQGHLVILSGVDNDNVFIHDSDYQPFMKYNKSQVEKAYKHPAITEEVVVAYGKKKK
jgi:ABC-type bacteriocin/lantibiotic exporter with double-glycine peptidase domain